MEGRTLARRMGTGTERAVDGRREVGTGSTILITSPRRSSNIMRRGIITRLLRPWVGVRVACRMGMSIIRRRHRHRRLRLLRRGRVLPVGIMVGDGERGVWFERCTSWCVYLARRTRAVEW